MSFKPVHSAIRWNKPLNEIEALLVSSDDVNCVDTSNGNYPIHIACQNGHLDIVKLLISKGANLNAKNGKGNTGIHMAVGYDYYEVARLLIDAGANPDLENDMGAAAHLGLEGDRCLGIAALVSAETASDVDDAFALCQGKISNANKSNFVAAGMKAKKAIGSAWTTAQQNAFKSFL